MRILRREHYRRMPWKNGGGLTEEVIAWPPSSDMGSFDWRISIAHVDADGPFSRFAGIDRTIALLDGGGLCLDLPDRTIVLDPESEPFAFSGDLDIASRNIDGPTVDLNVMTQRSRFRHRMRRMATNRLPVGPSGVIVVFNGPAVIVHGDAKDDFARFDALIADASDGPLMFTSNATVLVIEIDALQD